MCRILLALLVAGCSHPDTKPPVPQSAEEIAEAARQKAIAFRAQRADIARLQAIGDRLRIGAAPLCEETVPRFGWELLNNDSVPPAFRDLAIAEYQLGERLKLTRVTADGPAGRARLQPGDELTSIEGNPAPSGADAHARMDDTVLPLVKAGQPIHMEFLRAGRLVAVAVSPEPSCPYPVMLAGGEKINAAADGRGIFVSPGMVRFAHDDTELALVMAHEMSHNLKHHLDTMRKNAQVGAGIGAVFDVLAAVAGVYGNAFSRLGGATTGATATP